LYPTGQVRRGLANIFDALSCKGVAKEIKTGRNVKENVRFGIRMCVHDKLGPTVDVKTMKFYPQSKKEKVLENKFIDKTNKLLNLGGYGELTGIKEQLRKKDAQFRRRVQKLKRKH